MQNNQEFKLVILEDLGMQYATEASKRKTRFSLCECHCGKQFKVQTADLKNNKRKSCGCLNQRRKFENKKESIKYHKKLYRIKHKKEIAEKLKIYYQQNKEKILEQRREYFKENKESIMLKNSIYNSSEKGKLIKKNTQYKRRCSNKNGDLTTIELTNFINNSKVCYWCNCKINKDNLNIDHYIPIAKGGEHTLSNLVASCSHCNKTKSAKDPYKFANSIGRLL